MVPRFRRRNRLAGDKLDVRDPRMVALRAALEGLSGRVGQALAEIERAGPRGYVDGGELRLYLDALVSQDGAALAAARESLT